MPCKRSYTVAVIGVEKVDYIVAESLGETITVNHYYEKEQHILKIEIPEINIEKPVTLHFPNGLTLADNEISQHIFKILSKARLEYELKEKIYHIICSERKREHILNELLTMGISIDLLSAISEVLFSV